MFNVKKIKADDAAWLQKQLIIIFESLQRLYPSFYDSWNEVMYDVLEF